MLDKIAVDGKAVCVLPEVYPIGFDLNGPIPLLQKQDVGYHLGAGIGFERIVGQTDRTQQFCPLCNVLSDFGGLLIHGVAGGDKSHHTARTHLIQCLCKEKVVDGKAQPIISRVIDLILTKGHITDGKIVKIPAVGALKARYGDVRFGVELLCDTPRDAVQLHAVEPATPHGFRQTTKEVTHAHGRFQDVAGAKAHLLDGVVDALDDNRTCVMGVQGGASCGSVFLGGQQFFQFGIFLAPVLLFVVKGFRKPAPAHIAG